MSCIFGTIKVLNIPIAGQQPPSGLEPVKEAASVPRRISLTRGKYAIVDDDDFRWIRDYKWYFGGGGYPARGIDAGNDNVITVYMHRLIMKARNEEKVDHRNGNTLDNRKVNLRMATTSQNGANSRKSGKRSGRTTSSRYKGVCWVSSQKRWRAYITVNKKRHHLGRFTDEKEAAKAYDAVALYHFGEFAMLNFPPEIPDLDEVS